jgi:Outer membrane protein beta-barrel domain/PDZ domain
MRVGALSLVLALLFCGSVFAQGDSRVEVFGGYSYLNIDTNGLSDRQSANGWEASVSGNFNHRFAVEGSVAGYYKTYSFDFSSIGLGIVDVHVHDYSYLAGPRINFKPVFVHALIGGDHLTGSALGASASQDSFAAAFGGGLQWKVAPQWAVRGSADYVLTHHNIFGSVLDSYTQNNFRASVGVVYMFGGAREPSPRSQRDNRRPATACSNPAEAALLGVSGCGISSGFEVSSVRPGSPASAAGISPGDVITSIDGRAVRDSREIEQAIAANTSGVVKIDYLIKGSWSTERDVKLR